MDSNLKIQLDNAMKSMEEVLKIAQPQIEKIADSGTEEEKIELAKAFDEHKLDESIEKAVREYKDLSKSFR